MRFENQDKIKKKKQDWSLGAFVKVGFLTLKIIALNSDGSYMLESTKGLKYNFVPYQGLERLS